MSTQSKELSTVYLILGDDSLKKADVISRLEKRMEDFGDLSFNETKIDASDCSISEVIAACNTLPFMSEKRLVIFAHIDSLNTEQLNKIAEYLNAPSETTVLALVGEKLAKNTKLYKKVDSFSNAIINCDLPKEQDLPALVKSLAASMGASINQDAIAELCKRVGSDTITLQSELEKLALKNTNSHVISKDDVKNYVRDNSEEKPWVFLDALSKRDLKNTISTYKKLSSASPYYVISMIQNRLRELIVADEIIKSENITSAAAALGKKDWQIKNYPTFLRMYREGELESLFIKSIEVEAIMKSSSEAETVLIDFMVQLCK